MGEEKLEFTHSFLIIGNLALIAWVLIAFLSMWFYNQTYGIVLVIITAALIYLILRRLGCSSCYACKACTSGFGRLAGAFFGTGQLKKGSVGNRIGLILFIYLLLIPLPIASSIISLTEMFSFIKTVVLVFLLIISAYSLSTWLIKKI